MSTPLTLGANRQMWFAKLTDTTPQWSFLEDPAGTVKRAAVYGRSLRLGDPINVGPNSTWHQLTWEGGELQDIWNDKQMYQWGDADVLTYSGKARPWPGLQTWLKDENLNNQRRVIFSQGSRSDISQYQQVLWVAFGDTDIGHDRAPSYSMYELHPGYARGDSRAVQWVMSTTEPFRFVVPANADDGSANIQYVGTAAHLYTLIESTHAVVEDTGAPLTTSAGYQFMQDSAVSFNGALYYAHGNRLYKRVGKPPYGTVGTHTLVHWNRPALYLRGMCVWNNRIYYGVQYPNGRSAVYVTDGATVTKAFDIPQQFQLYKLRAVAGSLYILGQQTSDMNANNDPSGSYGNIVQQLWRYDGTSLKKLWQQGDFSDAQMHWASDLTDWNGYVVWGRQGTPNDGAKANLMFYDPVRDAIVRGPGINLDAANKGSAYGHGLWITGLGTWHNTVVAFFKDDTDYAHNLKRPGVVVSMRAPNYIKNDFRWHTIDQAGDVSQFKANLNERPSCTLVSSEYHGDEDVATETKTWLSVRLRVRQTGSRTKLQVYVLHPDGQQFANLTNTTATLIGTVTPRSTSATGAITEDYTWRDVILTCKNAAGNYLQYQKIQLLLVFTNTSGDYNNTDLTWVDDVAVQWTLAPRKRRQWSVRIPVTDGQLTLAGGANALTTGDLLAQKLEDLFFTAMPIKFWEPTASAATPSNTSYVEATITDFQRSQARMSSAETATVGFVTATIIENVLS